MAPAGISWDCLNEFDLDLNHGSFRSGRFRGAQPIYLRRPNSLGNRGFAAYTSFLILASSRREGESSLKITWRPTRSGSSQSCVITSASRRFTQPQTGRTLGGPLSGSLNTAKGIGLETRVIPHGGESGHHRARAEQGS